MEIFPKKSQIREKHNISTKLNILKQICTNKEFITKNFTEKSRKKDCWMPKKVEKESSFLRS